jgi:hypothetical protein
LDIRNTACEKAIVAASLCRSYLVKLAAAALTRPLPDCLRMIARVTVNDSNVKPGSSESETVDIAQAAQMTLDWVLARGHRNFRALVKT